MDDLSHARLPQSLKIGFDGTCLANRRGFGRFARGILEGLAQTNPGHRLEVVLDRPSLERVTLPDGVAALVVETSKMQSEAASARGNRSPGELWAMARAVHKARFDLYYLPTTLTYVPQLPWKNLVVTMHDTLAVDRPDLVFPTRKGRWFWWAKERAARWNASRLTTVSETSRGDLARYFHLKPERIGLLTEGVDKTFLKCSSDLPSFDSISQRYEIAAKLPYWLYVGGLSPHKNLLRLIEAFSLLPNTIGQLVIVGDFGDTFHTHIPELRQKVADCGVTDRVVFTGFVPDDALAVLYRKAQAVVLPSLWEGFGLPAAEAMACGTAVLHSSAGSLPEIVGDAGLLFNPLDVADIAEKWLRLAGDESLRRQLSANGLARSRRYRWDVAGRLLWRELETFVGLPGENAISKRRPL